MKIKINNDYVIRSSQYQYILSKPNGKDKEGKELFKDIGYYPTIEQTLAAFADYHIKTADINSFEELTEELHKVRKVLADINKKLEVSK
ncbi:TPA: hypothetical protein ACX1L3_000975 [Listeria monocytogenes]|uniref:hypothetical protein n=1 Tax=Listeria monocytogenes TaxID=1639 RepID=UPI000EDDD445|nr:hypothetical protein [Listeria monocytogenes]EAC3591520.1 hypothetical protein [Listeria monocytogenes]EAC5876868.1 hypothetical protein [Listeria monocytogenes]EAC6773278.1 hypothetical protein [Listeria monocytogenes]EAD4831853.1 hypothetical protein [Listeria monocytogenes]EAD8886190.1 hypothetical protein [Listeria monocytogenes]